MDFSKIFAIISSFVLIVCLTLCITTLVVLRNAIDENETLQADAVRLVKELDTSVDKLDTVIADNQAQGDLPTNAAAEIFSIRECNGKIAVYNDDGVMLHWVDVNTALLPAGERTALAQGIEVQGWESVISCLQDYQS